MPMLPIIIEFTQKGEVQSVKRVKEVSDAIDDAKKAAKDMTSSIDAAWKALGARPRSAIATEMKGIVTAFRDVKNSANVTAQDVSRAQEAMREKLRKLSEEARASAKATKEASETFSQASEKISFFGMTMGKLAGVAVGFFAINKIKDAALHAFNLAAQYETLGVVVQQVGKVNGYSAVEIDKNVSAIRRMGIAGVEARQTMTQLLQAQVDITQTPALARIAQDAAVIGGTNSSEAFERLVHGIQSAQTDVLRTIGISVNFEQAYAKMATQVGKTTAELTEQERVQARTNAVMEAGERISGTYEAALSTVGKQISSLTRLQNDFMTDFGKLPLEVAKATGVIDKYSAALDQMSRTTLSSRAKLAGISQTSLEAAFASGGTQGGRDLVESVESAKDEIASLESALGSLAARGVDLSGVSEPFRKMRDEFFANQEEIIRLERLLLALSEDDVGTSSIVARLEAVRSKTSDASTEMQKLRSVMATVFSIATSRGGGGDDDAHVQVYSKALEKQLTTVDEAYTKTASRAKELKIQAVKDQQSALQNLVAAGKLTAQEAAVREKAFKAELESLNKNGSNSASKVENATEKWKQFRLEIAALNGEGAKSAVTLEKQNKEIEDAGKAAGKSASEISQMQADYAAAFQGNTLKEFNKHVVELEGNTAALRDLKIEEEVRKWTTELSSAGVAGADLEGKITRLKDALAKQAEVKDAQTSLSFIKEYSQLSGDFSQNQKYLLEMSEAEEKIYRATLPASLQPYIDKWQELKKLQEARDPLSGSIRGLRSYSNEAMNLAKGIEGAWTSGFQGMEDALVKFTMSGKLSFSDMANSIISDLMRIAIRSSITGPLASGLGSLFSGWGGGSSASFGSSSAFNIGTSTIGMGTAIVKHAGGMVDGFGPTRSVPLSAFDYAPRFHSGGGFFKRDEYPAILQYGERVLNRQETAAYNAREWAGRDLAGEGGGYSGSVTNNLIVTPPAGYEANENRTRNSSGGEDLRVTFSRMVAAEVGSYGSPINKALQRQGMRSPVVRQG